MTDLPAHGLFQQLNTRPVSGEHLEVLGKKASAAWGQGQHPTLTSAVVETVKHAGLSAEQVRRVVEFANTDAYLSEFKKEGMPHKVIDFGDGGPADPSTVLQELNVGEMASPSDSGVSDYAGPPGMAKAASAAEEDLAALFGKTASAQQYPAHNPYSEVLDLRDKLAGAYDHLTSELSGLELMYADLAERLYQGVKQASLGGHSLGEVVQAWGEVVPSVEHVKVAVAYVTPRLLAEEVFYSKEGVARSFEKTAGARHVNPAHPLVVDFGEYCEVLDKLAELRATRDEVHAAHQELTNFVKAAAAEGLVPRVVKAVHQGAEYAGTAGEHVAKHLFGEGAKETGRAVGRGAAYAAAATPAVLVGESAYRHAQNSPTAQGVGKFVAGRVPGTQSFYERQYRMQGGM